MSLCSSRACEIPCRHRDPGPARYPPVEPGGVEQQPADRRPRQHRRQSRRLEQVPRHAREAMEHECDLDHDPRRHHHRERENGAIAAQESQDHGDPGADPDGRVIQRPEAIDRADHLVGVELPRGFERQLAGDVGLAVGDRRDAEPEEHRYERRRVDHPPHRGMLDEQPDSVDGQEGPHLRTSESRQHGDPPCPREPTAQEHVDRRQAAGDEHRVRLGAEDVVEVLLNPEHRGAGEDRGHDRRVPAAAVRRLGRGQPVGDPPPEHGAGQRDRDGGQHPKVEGVVAEQRVGHVEDIGERLPRGRAAQVQRAVQRLVAPDQPPVRVITRARVGPAQDDSGDHDDRNGHQPPGIAHQERRL
jgi:hypothetical protein